MNNPIIDNKWEAHGAVFEFAWDFSSLTIRKNGASIVLPMHAITNLGILIDQNIHADGDELASTRLWNSTATSMVCPTSEEDY